jgi:peptidoglycan/LPS O-acetylase OafA/YrhL
MKHARQSFDGFKAGAYFDALDGLRAISILLVLLHHVPRFSAPHFLNTLQENGRYGVAFFFVISGFLIGTLLLREQEKNGRIDLWKFYGRRALRLLPLYYAALLLQAVMVFVLRQYTPENQALFAEKLPSYVFYYSNWLATATQGPFFQAWSLAVEEQFYLAFGLLLFFARSRTVILATLAALLVKFFVYEAYGAVDAGSTLWRVVFSYREPVLFGVLAAFALNRRRGFELFQRGLDSTPVITFLGLATAGWLCLHLMRHESFWDAQLLYLLMTLTVIGLAIRPATAFVNNRFMMHIGKISYGIYLLHMFVIATVKKLPGGEWPAFCFLLSTAMVIIVASLVYKFFEQPIIAFYKRRLSPYNTTTRIPAAQEEIPAASAPPVEQPGRVPI